jgi:hypothetical protein
MLLHVGINNNGIAGGLHAPALSRGRFGVTALPRRAARRPLLGAEGAEARRSGFSATKSVSDRHGKQSGIERLMIEMSGLLLLESEPCRTGRSAELARR